MKAFELKIGLDIEYIAAHNILNAVLFYCKEIGFDIDDFDLEDDISELTPEQMETITLRDEDLEIDDPNYSLSISKIISELTQPSIIGSTAY